MVNKQTAKVIILIPVKAPCSESICSWLLHYGFNLFPDHIVDLLAEFSSVLYLIVRNGLKESIASSY